jgi:carbon-monoxide dehydrogenase large subunit
LRKREDVPLIKGLGCFADDAVLDAPLQVAFVRSMVVGRLIGLDTQDAGQMEGVLAVHGAGDLAGLGALSVNPVIPMTRQPPYPILAGPQIGATGQPVAAVLANTAAQALDAAEAVFADIEDALTPPEVIATQSWSAGDAEAAFNEAAHVVQAKIAHPRLAPSPMEPRGIAARYDAQTASVTLWHATQTPHRTRSELARILDVDPARIRVVAGHVGGAFGMKASLYPEEVFVAWAALHHQRDVRWTATRSEDFLAATHGRGITSTGALAVDAQGRFLGLRAQIDAPLGPWLPNSALIPAWNAARILPSGYCVPAVEIETTAWQVPRGPTGIYRGAGRPEANALMERLIDKAAHASGHDPVALRRINLLPQDALPHQTATGNTLDSGRYAAALDALCQKAGYEALLASRDARREAGELVGIGVAFYVEPSGSGWESARVTLNADGSALVASGSSSQGHARETAFAQIAGDALGLPVHRIDVALGDTGHAPEGIGALASRSTAIGGSAVLQACQQITVRRDAGDALPLTAEVRYENDGQAWGYGAYLVQLCVCAETGVPTVERALCVDDAGVLISDALVEGQIVGGFAQGIGEALMESVVYDADGQLLTGSFMDYAMPRAVDVPLLEVHKIHTPSPMNLLGAKGVGEAGTIGAPAAVLNAAHDALGPLGITDLQMPLTPATLWHAMKEAKR